MTALDRKLYRQGTEVQVDVMHGGRRRVSVACNYIRPVGRGGLHLVAEQGSGQMRSVPIENIGRKH